MSDGTYLVFHDVDEHKTVGPSGITPIVSSRNQITVTTHLTTHLRPFDVNFALKVQVVIVGKFTGEGWDLDYISSMLRKSKPSEKSSGPLVVVLHYGPRGEHTN